MRNHGHLIQVVIYDTRIQDEPGGTSTHIHGTRTKM